MRTSDFDYELPPELIAQEPLSCRTDSRMMVLDRTSRNIEHRKIGEIVDFLDAGDLLVLNNTRVFPARIFGARRESGGQVELLLIEQIESSGPKRSRWEVFYRASRRAAAGLALDLADGHIAGTVVALCDGGRVLVELESDAPLMEVLERYGVPPVPPYIRRERDGKDARVTLDRERYQTVYASETGAVAAPTAGLHFTDELLDAAVEKGVGKAVVTLHVGPGTFRPVSSEQLEDHLMEAERYDIGEEAARLIEATRSGSGRVVAVGSTTVRTLESVFAEHGRIIPCSGRTELFIHPPRKLKVIDAMLTNFHLPRSTLLMMVSALAGRDFVMEAYREAVRNRYRFYSYGDCMLIV